MRHKKVLKKGKRHNWIIEIDETERERNRGNTDLNAGGGNQKN